MRQKTWIRALGAFLAFMAVLTVASRGAASVNTPRVTLMAPQNQLIVHKVTGSGQTEGTVEVAVFVKEGLLVEQVLAAPGQKVEKGEALLVLWEDSLREALRGAEERLQTLEEQLGDLESQRAAEQAKRERERAYARQSYAQSAVSAQVQVDIARTEANIANQRLEEFYRDRQFSDGSLEDEELERTLSDDLRMKQEALNQALASYHQSMVDAQAAVAEAGAAPALEGGGKALEREMENAREELAVYQELMEKGGVVEAPEEGVVKQVDVQTGGQTPREAALLLYRSGESLRLTIPVEKEAVKYVELGALVRVTDSEGRELTGAVAKAFKEDEGEDQRLLTIEIPKGQAYAGQSLKAEITKEEGPYGCCVPMAALHEENNAYFVYVAEPRDTILGEVLTARRVAVEVENHDERTAALKGGSLSQGQQVVVNADREVTEGSQIRLWER